MKLTHIVPSLESRHGGPSISVPALAAACAEIGHDVNLFSTGTGAGASRVEGRLATRILPRDWPPFLCPSTALHAALSTDTPDIVHHHALWLRTLHYAHRAAQAKGAKLVVSPRGMMSPWAWKNHRLRKVLASALIHPGALRAASGWHATSTEEADDIRRLGFTQPICVAPNGVRPPAADQLIAAGAGWRERCPMIGQRPVALFYSRFHRKKRLRELFHLWLAAPRGDWVLMLVGLPEEYSIAEVQKWITAAGAEDRVVVHDGTNLPPPYSVASLFLLPSHSENFGLVIAEAMAAGVPVVVSDSTPWSAVNADGRGWCVPWADFHRTLQVAMAESPARLSERGQRARTWVLQEFSWKKSAAQLVAFYGQLRPSVP
jgi:glycosyltransferase involved in cell wall biosynthesis